MKKQKGHKILPSFSEHLDKQYGKRGTAKREKYEQEYETFKLGVLIHSTKSKG